MTTTTVIAKDTSSAMDDIMSKLGDDAVILSTKHKDGKVHMTATTENVSTTPTYKEPTLHRPVWCLKMPNQVKKTTAILTSKQ